MDCNTCKFGNNKTVATCVDCHIGDEFTNWQSEPDAFEPVKDGDFKTEKRVFRFETEAGVVYNTIEVPVVNYPKDILSWELLETAKHPLKIFTNWQSEPDATLTRTAEQWSKIDATMVAAECSPSMIRELIEDAQRDIAALHTPVHSPERFNGQP